MPLTSAEKRNLKALARQSNWSEIERLYGTSNVEKGRKYLMKKQKEANKEDSENASPDAPINDDSEDEPNLSLTELKATVVAAKLKKKKNVSLTSQAGPDSILSPLRTNGNDDNEETTNDSSSFSIMKPLSLASVSDMYTTGNTDNGLDNTVLVSETNEVDYSSTVDHDSSTLLSVPKVPKVAKKMKLMKLQPKVVLSSSSSSNDNDISMLDASDEATDATKSNTAADSDSDADKFFVKRKPSKTKKTKPSLVTATSTTTLSSSLTVPTEKKRAGPLAPSAFILYSTEMRPTLKAEGLAFGEMGKRLGEMWKTLDPETKQIYTDRSETLKAAAKAKLGITDDEATGTAIVRPKKAAAGPTVKKSTAKKMKRSNDDDAIDSSSADDSERDESIEASFPAPLAANGKATKVTSSSSSSSAVSAKGKGKRGRSRKGSDDDDNDNDSEATDDADIIHYTWEDPRKAAEEKALARKQAGKGSRINNGVIELVMSPDNMNDSVFSEERCMPHLPCRMDYSSYLFRNQDEIAFVLPAYIDWMEEIRNGASRSFSGDDGTMVAHDSCVTATQVLATLTEKYKLPSSIEHLYSLTDTGVVDAQVIRMECVGTAMDILPVASTTDDASSKPGFPADAEIIPTNGYFTKGNRRYQWYLVTLAIDTHRNDEEENDDEESTSTGTDRLTVTIPWLPPQHPLITSPFILRAQAYRTAMDDAIKPGTQCRMPLVTGDNVMEGEWYEGRVYAVNPRKIDKDNGWVRSPYKSVRVIWYEQDADTKAWYIDVLQQESPVSPWELRTKNLPFVTKDNVRIFVETEAPPKLLTPVEIITYIKTLEAAVFFQSPVPKSEINYHSRIKHPMDLGTIYQRAMNGVYDEGSSTVVEDDDEGNGTTTRTTGKNSSASTKTGNRSRGMNGLWDDLRLIVKNAKVFNQPERAEWRTADMLECELRRIKSAYKFYTSAGTTTLSSSSSSSSSSLFSSSSSAAVMMMDDDWDTLNELEYD